MLAIMNLKSGKVYFSSHFQRFQFMVRWLHCFRACAEAERSRQEVHSGTKLFMAVRKQREREREREREKDRKGQSPNIPFKVLPPIT
jgi:hypothetical protein